MNNTDFSNLFSFRIYHSSISFVNPRPLIQGATENFVGIILSGKAKFKTKNTVLELNKGDVFFIPKGQFYQSEWLVAEKGNIKYLGLAAANLPVTGNPHYTLQIVRCSDDDKSLLYEISDDCSVNCKTVGLFYTFLGRILQTLERDVSQNDLILEKALEYMHSNDNYQMYDIATHCDISVTSLYTLFKRNLNKTPNEVKQMILCEKAVKLLETTNYSIETISDKLNFSSSSYFRKIFKKYISKTPRQIRKDSIIL